MQIMCNGHKHEGKNVVIINLCDFCGDWFDNRHNANRNINTERKNLKSPFWTACWLFLHYCKPINLYPLNRQIHSSISDAETRLIIIMSVLSDFGTGLKLRLEIYQDNIYIELKYVNIIFLHVWADHKYHCVFYLPCKELSWYSKHLNDAVEGVWKFQKVLKVARESS